MNESYNLLQKHFDTAFDTPDGIKKLRELILTLAMQGKLVPQDPNDQPAGELLKEIAAEKARLIKAGKLKPQKPLPPLNPKEIPYQLPSNWQWARLEDLCEMITDGTHHTPNYVETGVPFLSVKDLSSGFLDFSNTRFISPDEHDELKKRCCPELGDVLLTKVGTTGIAVAVDTEQEFSLFVSVALLKTIKPCVNPDYLTKLINSPLIRKFSEEGTEGVGNKNLVLRKIKAFLTPIPPIAEQKRIVARIEQLMGRCDELERLRAERDRMRLDTHAAAINQLLSASDSENFSTAWRFITSNFAELYSVKENVAELRKTILQLAVMGKLVPQDPNDQPASELLKEIAAEKARLIKAGKLKPQKPLPPIKPEEIPCQIPASWQWCRFEQIIDQHYPISYGVLVPGPDIIDGVPFVRIEDLAIKNPKKAPSKKISQEIASDYERTRLVGGEILMGVVGSIGKLGIAPESWKGAYIARAVCRIYPVAQVDKKYILWILQSNLMQSGFAGDTRTLAQPTLNIGLIRAATTPLPPLAEQKRIVARVDQLMALCDNLEKSIAAAGDGRTALLNAMMAKV
jgi:type I restriction enzyme S subunit